MDFVTSLPKSHKFTVILVVVDWLLNHRHFRALETHFISWKVAHILFSMIVKLHRVSRSIVIDKDLIFLS